MLVVQQKRKAMLGALRFSRLTLPLDIILGTRFHRLSRIGSFMACPGIEAGTYRLVVKHTATGLPNP